MRQRPGPRRTTKSTDCRPSTLRRRASFRPSLRQTLTRSRCKLIIELVASDDAASKWSCSCDVICRRRRIIAVSQDWTVSDDACVERRLVGSCVQWLRRSASGRRASSTWALPVRSPLSMCRRSVCYAEGAAGRIAATVRRTGYIDLSYEVTFWRPALELEVCRNAFLISVLL